MNYKLATVALMLAAAAGAVNSAVPKVDTAAPAADTAKADIAGEYTGTWQSTDGLSGKLRVTLKPHGSGWGAEAVFRFDDLDATTRMKAIAVEGTKVQLEFEWEHRENTGKTRLQGEVKGAVLSGTFESRADEKDSRGTWTVTRT